MALFCSLVCLALAYIGFKNDKRIYSASGFFCGFWAVLVALSAMRLYDLNATSDKAYTFILIGVFCFALGSSFMRKVKISGGSCSDKINDTVYNLLIIICLVSLIYNIRVLISYFSHGFNISYIYNTMARTSGGEATELTSLYSSWQERLQQYIGYPLLYTLVPVSIIGYVREKKKKYLIWAFILSFIRFVYDMRRTFVVIILVYVAVILLIRLKDVELPSWWTKKLKRRMLIGGIAVIFLFISMSTARRDETEPTYNFLYNLYTYYVGSIPYFSQRLEMINDIPYTFGMTSFRGMFAPIFAILGIVGFREPMLMTQATANIESLHNIVLRITPTHPFNSYATVFFEFYLDGGILGIVFFSFLFGFISCYLCRKCNKYGSMRDEFRYAYFFSMFLALSVLHFNASVVCYFWPFVIEKFLFVKDDRSTSQL